jgi:hypothetical protein
MAATLNPDFTQIKSDQGTQRHSERPLFIWHLEVFEMAVIRPNIPDIPSHQTIP